jgi:hypothetical protein
MVRRYVQYEWPWAYYINCVLWSCVCYTGIWIHWFRDLYATILNGSVTTGRTSLVGGLLEVGLDRAINVTYDMLCSG